MKWRHRISTIFSGWNLFFFVTVSCLILVFVVFQGYVISKQSTKTIEKHYNQIIFENMDSLTVNIANSLNYIDDFARTLSNNPNLIEILEHNDANTKMKVSAHIQSFSDYYHLRLPLNIQILTNEDKIYSYPSMDAEEEKDLRETISTFSWFTHRVTLDNNYLHSNVTMDYHHMDNSNALYISKNIIQNNRSLGLLVIEMNGSLIERMLNRVEINNQNSVFIISEEGQILFRNENIPVLSPRTAPLFDIVKIYKSIKTQNSDFGSYELRSANKRYDYKYKRIPSTSWIMVSLNPQQSLDSGSSNIWRITAVTTGLSILLMGTFIYFLYIKITFPIHQLSKTVKRAGDGLYSKMYPYKGFKELETLNRGIFQFFEQIQAQIQTIKHGETEKRRLELHILQEQMRPHFWHNCLNSLRFMAVLHGNQTMEEAILSLTRMLDYTLKNTDVIFSTLEEEKDYAISYVRFQEIRSMQKIRLLLDLDPRSLQVMIPKFSLQPIIENAITHGFLTPFDKEPCIQIITRIEANSLIIRIIDNGIGMDSETQQYLFDFGQKQSSERKTSGISLINLRRRIQLEFGEPFGILIESEINEFTQVIIILPYIGMDDKVGGLL